MTVDSAEALTLIRPTSETSDTWLVLILPTSDTSDTWLDTAADTALAAADAIDATEVSEPETFVTWVLSADSVVDMADAFTDMRPTSDTKEV